MPEFAADAVSVGIEELDVFGAQQRVEAALQVGDARQVAVAPVVIGPQVGAPA